MNNLNVKPDFEEPLFDVILVEEFDIITTSDPNLARRSINFLSAEESDEDFEVD